MKKHVPSPVSLAIGNVLLVALSVWIRGASPAAAIVAIDRDFPDLVAKAEQIVVGTVAQIREDGDAAGGPFTYVTFEPISVLKGDVGSSLTLRFFGGSAGDTTVRISDMPTFTLGERALLFVAGNGDVICPLVGIWQGRFRVRYDESRGSEVVEDHGGTAITGRVGRHLRRQRGKRSDPPALSLDQFRQLVADELVSPTP